MIKRKLTEMTILLGVAALFAGTQDLLAAQSCGKPDPDVADTRDIKGKKYDVYLDCLNREKILAESFYQETVPTIKVTAQADKVGNATKPATVPRSLGEIQAEIDVAKSMKESIEDEKQFLGFNWGLGVGAAFGRGEPRVESAEIANGIVRVTKDVTDAPRIVLEIHHFFVQPKVFGTYRFGHGPFAAVNFGASNGETLSSFGVGWMLGWKRKEGSGSFNVGLGVMLDQNVQTFGDGITANQPLPLGESEIRFKQGSEKTALLFVSTTF